MGGFKSGYVHLAVIYVVWGSAYLGIKIGLSGPDAFSAFQLQAGRLLLGGILLGLVPLLTGRFVLPRGRDLAICILSAFLYWICGNGFVIIALRELPSGFVAMAMGSIPLWSALLRAVLARRRPRQLASLITGFGGLLLIYWPAITSSGSLAAIHPSWIAVAALMFAPITWVLATLLQPLLSPRVTTEVAASVQLVVGGLLALLIVVWLGVPLPAPPSAKTIWSLLYLAIIGSALSFASYGKAIRIFPPNVVAAFAYVNPVVGVVLGWLVLRETIEPVESVGMCIVIASVILLLNRSSPENPPDPAETAKRDRSDALAPVARPQRMPPPTAG